MDGELRGATPHARGRRSHGARRAQADVIVGVGAAAAASRVLQSLLFGLGTLDPISFAGVGALSLLIAL